MTPERAAEIAKHAVNVGATAPASLTWIDIIQQIIIQACAEQREQDARICEDMARKQNRADSAYAGAVNCARAIREGK